MSHKITGGPLRRVFSPSAVKVSQEFRPFAGYGKNKQLPLRSDSPTIYVRVYDSFWRIREPEQALIGIHLANIVRLRASL